MKLFFVTTTAAVVSSAAAFLPANLRDSRTNVVARQVTSSVPGTIVKPTGTSFLPPETIERCKVGSPIEKAKMEKDGTAAWVDVYEYARKIRQGEMTWEEVEKNDLDTVSTLQQLKISSTLVP
jgi:ferredoxin-nitrite reductase